MEQTFFVVRSFINGREGCRPSEFSTEEAARLFINILKDNSIDAPSIQCEYHLYEVKEIDI